MKSFLKLIRWQNLLMVILTMVLMRYAVIAPVLSKIGVILIIGSGEEMPMSLQFPWYDFVLLVAATVLITAGGYVINDYFDIKTDLINKGKVIVGTKIPRRQAILWHSVFNIAGVAAGFYISYKAGYIWLGSMFLVALLTAMVPMLVAFYEWPALYKYYAANAIRLPNINFILYWVGGFALFAFLTNLIREIIKDIEDFEGDIVYGRNTVPVVIGVLSAKVVSVCLITITIILLYLTWHFFINDLITLVYITSAIVFPLGYVIYKLLGNGEKKHLHRASRMMKIVMLTGILYSIVVKIILTWNLF